MSDIVTMDDLNEENMAKIAAMMVRRITVLQHSRDYPD